MFGMFRSKARRLLDTEVARFARDITSKVDVCYLQHLPIAEIRPSEALAATAFQIGLVFEASKAYFGPTGNVSDAMASTITRQVCRLRGNVDIAAEILRSARADPDELVGRFFQAGRREAGNCLRGVPDKDALLGLFEQEWAQAA